MDLFKQITDIVKAHDAENVKPKTVEVPEDVYYIDKMLRLQALAKRPQP